MIDILAGVREGGDRVRDLDQAADIMNNSRPSACSCSWTRPIIPHEHPQTPGAVCSSAPPPRCRSATTSRRTTCCQRDGALRHGYVPRLRHHLLGGQFDREGRARYAPEPRGSQRAEGLIGRARAMRAQYRHGPVTATVRAKTCARHALRLRRSSTCRCRYDATIPEPSQFVLRRLAEAVATLHLHSYPSTMTALARAPRRAPTRPNGTWAPTARQVLTRLQAYGIRPLGGRIGGHVLLHRRSIGSRTPTSSRSTSTPVQISSRSTPRSRRTPMSSSCSPNETPGQRTSRITSSPS